MRVYRNLVEAMKETERDLFEMGVLVKGIKSQGKDIGKAGWTREIIGHTYSIPLTCAEQWSQIEPALEALEIRPGRGEDFCSYILMEISDRLGRTGKQNPGNAYLWRLGYWRNHMELDGKFSYTYDERIAPWLDNIISLLRRDPGTRQAILPIWRTSPDNPRVVQGTRRVPCSMYYQFFIRDRFEGTVLDMHYVMRSCDLYTHFPFDVVFACKLGLYVGKRLGIAPGRLVHTVGSLHTYYSDLEKRGIF